MPSSRLLRQAVRPSLAAIGVSALLLLATSCQEKPDVKAASKKQADPTLDVRVARVESRDVKRVVESVGTLYPFDETVVSAEIDGKVEEVKIDLGDQVQAGQVMVRLGDEEQRNIVSQNEAQLRQSLERLGLKDEKDKLADPKEAPEPRRAAAELQEAEQRFKRQQQLFQQQIGAQADLDQSAARYRAALAAYDATLFQTRNLGQEVERFKFQLELQRKKLRDTSVRAPFSGAVKERLVNPGQFVRANTPVVTLVKTSPLRLKLEVPERMAPWVQNGQIVQVAVEAYESEPFQGKVWRISPTVDQQKRTFIVEALVDNALGRLKPGSYARARVPTGKVERTMIVPARAVSYVFGANKVYLVKNGLVEARDVKTGDRFDQNIEILEGLSEGDSIALTQLNRLDTGMKVRVATGDAGAGKPNGP